MLPFPLVGSNPGILSGLATAANFLLVDEDFDLLSNSDTRDLRRTNDLDVAGLFPVRGLLGAIEPSAIPRFTLWLDAYPREMENLWAFGLGIGMATPPRDRQGYKIGCHDAKIFGIELNVDRARMTAGNFGKLFGDLPV